MKRIKVNLDKISDFDLKLAQNPHIIALIDEIIALSLEERAQQYKALQEKIQQGKASLFEERVHIKLLERRTAEWIRLIHKNLPAIEKELSKRKQAQQPPATDLSKPPVPSPPPSGPSNEYPSELLEFLATQKPPTSPVKLSKQSQSSRPGSVTSQKRSPLRYVRDIGIGALLMLCLLFAVWYVLSSEETSPPLTTFGEQALETSGQSEASSQLQQQLQTEFDTAAHELRFGEFEKGKTQLLNLIETYPASPRAEDAYVLLGDTYRQRQNDPDEALKYYQAFTEKYPDSSQFGLVQLKMGFSYEDMEDTASAKAIYQLLIQHKGQKSRLGQLAHERLSSLQESR